MKWPSEIYFKICHIFGKTKNPCRYVVFSSIYACMEKALFYKRSVHLMNWKGVGDGWQYKLFVAQEKKLVEGFFFVLLKMLLLLEAIRRNRYLILANTKSRIILYITFGRMQKKQYFFFKKNHFHFFHFNFRHLYKCAAWVSVVCLHSTSLWKSFSRVILWVSISSPSESFLRLLLNSLYGHSALKN